MDMARVQFLLSAISCKIFDTELKLEAHYDKRASPGQYARIYIQVAYNAKCNKTGIEESWTGRKWQLSEYMTPDEVVKTAFAAFKAAVEHEVLEGFKLDGVVVFNPHISVFDMVSFNREAKEVKRS